MRILIFAIAAALIAVPAKAATESATSLPLPLDITSELLVGVANTCKVPADVRIFITDGTSNTVLRRKHVTVAAGRGTILTYHSETVNRDLVVAKAIVLGGPGAGPHCMLFGIAVRDWQTKVPRFIGETEKNL